MSGSLPTKKLIRQNTDVSESDTSECFTTPPSSPLKERALSPAQKSPVSWNSNPLYKTSQSSSAGSSPARSPTRSQSFRSTVSSFGAESSPLGSPTHRRSLRNTSKSSSFESPTGTSSHFTFSKPSSTFGSRFSPPTKRVQSVNNRSSVFSQQNVKSSTEPPCPPTRKDSITKARKNSRKLDAENMLYGAKDTVQENGEDSEHIERRDSFNKENRPKEVRVEFQSKRKESPTRTRTSSVGSNKEDNEVPVNCKIDTSDKDDILKGDKVTFNVKTDSKSSKNYLDGFLIDAPDNTLIKPSKLRESMRRNRARRAQTAPVERQDVDKALEEIDRKWGKPERSTALSHLPLADRLAFRKMRSEREQNNNEINRLLKKEMSSNIGVNKVLTTSTSSNVPSDDSITPITTSASSSVFESPTITPVLHLSSTTSTSPTRTPASPKHVPGSPPQSDTSTSEPLSPRLSTLNNPITPDQQDMSGLKEACDSEFLETKRRLQNGRSYSLDDHVSICK